MFSRHKYAEPNDKRTWVNLPDPAASIKFDGGSFFLVFNKEGKPEYFSRRPSVKGGFPNRTASLPHLSDFQLPEMAGHVFNGELIHTGFDKSSPEKHSVVSGILNSLSPKAIDTQSKIGPIRYVLHDVINPVFSTYGEKLSHMKKLEELVNKPDLIYTPKIYTNHEDIHNLIRSTKSQGREGVIITSLKTPEHENVRYKIKHVDTYNLLVSGVIQEVDKDGHLKPSMGALVLKDATGKEVAKVGTGFSRNDRIDAWKHPENWIGRLIQVKSMGFAVNALRMPVFNGDADGDIDTVS